jgi:hypothetical protein
MMKLMERVRIRRDAARRDRAIHGALRDAHSPALRRELMEIMSRYDIDRAPR